MTSAPFDDGNHRFRVGVRRFVARELAPRAERWEKSRHFPRQALAACGRQGYLSLASPRMAVLTEELARCESMGVALTILVQAALVAPLLSQLGSKDQQHTYLAPLRAGRQVGAMAVTEPDAGSDLAALRCQAEDRPGAFVLTGEKTYITNAAAADFLIVAARSATNADAGMSLFLVPADARGVSIHAIPSLGLNTTAMGRIVLRQCRVPRESLLGEPGAAFGYVQDALSRERLFGGIGAVAWAEYAVEKTSAYLRTRRAFGRTINRFQAVRHQLADVATHLEAARQLNYAAYRRWSEGHDAMKHIAMMKLFSFREAQRAIEICLQLHGGLGYRDDHWVSRWYRDARALTIAAGTPEVMREVIAACLRV
jgi:alkylation response protein AidB-like acyl-CoA dehydrogenase